MSTTHCLVRLTAALLLFFAAQTGHAWGVLGCDFVGDVPGFVNCINNASSQAASRAAANAGKAYEDTIDGLEAQIEDLEDSPFFAGLPGEQQALLALRQMPIEPFNDCLTQAGLNFGAVMGGAMTNPVGFTQARYNEMLARSVALSGPMLDATLARLQSGQPLEPTPQTIAALVDEAYAAMTRLAQEDPVARCALPVVGPLQTQIKQAAITAFHQTRESVDQIVADTVRPAMDLAMTAALSTMLADIDGAAAVNPQAPAPPVRTAPVRTEPLPRREPTAPPPVKRPPPPAETPPPTKSPAPTGRTATLARSESAPVRTRSIRDVAQAVTGMAVPDDVQRIALGVFTARMLDPQRLQALAGEVNALSAAIADGNAAGFDTRDLDKLIDALAVPSDAIATELGIEVARFYGHWTIDKVGGVLVDLSLGSAAATGAVVSEVGGAICSIGDVFVGVPCAVVKGIVSWVYLQLALPLVNQGFMVGYHIGYEALVDCAATAIRLGQDPALRSPAGCGSLGPALRNFPSGEALAAFALPQVEQTRASLFAYQQAVRNLATMARAEGRR